MAHMLFYLYDPSREPNWDPTHLLNLALAMLLRSSFPSKSCREDVSYAAVIWRLDSDLSNRRFGISLCKNKASYALAASQHHWSPITQKYKFFYQPSSNFMLYIYLHRTFMLRLHTLRLRYSLMILLKASRLKFGIDVV